jgi:hypothetical protein
MRQRTYLEGCKVDDTVDIWMRGEDLVQFVLICDVDLVEYWSLAAEKLDAVQGDFGRVVKGIDNDYFVAMLQEGETREGANVAGASAIDVSSVHSSANASRHGGVAPNTPTGVACMFTFGSYSGTYPVINTVPTAIIENVQGLANECEECWCVLLDTKRINSRRRGCKVWKHDTQQLLLIASKCSKISRIP